MRLIATLLVCASTLSACRDSTPAPHFAVRDSAGIRIVESSAAAWDSLSSWRLEDASLSIGQEDGDSLYLLSRVAGAARLADGGIVIADGASNQLRFYNAQGKFVRSAGRSGEGPGEYEYLRGLRKCEADSLFAFDLNWQTKVYTPAGDLVREMTLLDPGTGRTPYALSCSGGRFLITGWGPLTNTPTIGFYRAAAPISVLSADGSLLASLGEFPSSERIGTERGSRPHPFGRSTSVALDSTFAYVGTAESLQILKFAIPATAGNVEGHTPSMVIRGPVADLAIRHEHLDRYRAIQIERASPQNRPALETSLRDMPLPPSFPAYTALTIDTEGNLWVKRFLRPGEDQPYFSVFDAEGVYMGDVRSPKDVEVVEIGRDYVLGVHRDELDIERVKLFQLLKPATPGR